MVGNCARDFEAALRAGRALPRMAGVAADFAEEIADLARTGTTPLLERLRRAAARARCSGGAQRAIARRGQRRRPPGGTSSTGTGL